MNYAGLYGRGGDKLRFRVEVIALEAIARSLKLQPLGFGLLLEKKTIIRRWDGNSVPKDIYFV